MTRTVPRPAATDVSAKPEGQEDTAPARPEAATGEKTVLSVPLTAADRGLIEAAARAARVSPEAFVLSHAAKAAEALLLRAGRHRVTKAQWQQIVQILKEAPAAGEETVEILIKNRK